MLRPVSCTIHRFVLSARLLASWPACLIYPRRVPSKRQHGLVERVGLRPFFWPSRLPDMLLAHHENFARSQHEKGASGT